MATKWLCVPFQQKKAPTQGERMWTNQVCLLTKQVWEGRFSKNNFCRIKKKTMIKIIKKCGELFSGLIFQQIYYYIKAISLPLLWLAGGHPCQIETTHTHFMVKIISCLIYSYVELGYAAAHNPDLFLVLGKLTKASKLKRCRYNCNTLKSMF